MDVNPIYADGPLKGSDFKAPGAPPRPVAALDGESQVAYHFHRFTLFDRTIWIGAVGPVDSISKADLFDLIVSDRAKQACEPGEHDGT